MTSALAVVPMLALVSRLMAMALAKDIPIVIDTTGLAQLAMDLDLAKGLLVARATMQGGRHSLQGMFGNIPLKPLRITSLYLSGVRTH